MSVEEILLQNPLLFNHSVVSNSLRPHGLFSPPGSSVHEISQARILEWVAISFSRASFQPRVQIHVSCLAGGFFTTQSPGKPFILNTGLNINTSNQLQTNPITLSWNDSNSSYFKTLFHSPEVLLQKFSYSKQHTQAIGKYLPITDFSSDTQSGYTR